MKPTYEQAREVFLSMDRPATRPFAAAMKAKGYTVSKSTLARWLAKGFEDVTVDNVVRMVAKQAAKIEPKVAREAAKIEPKVALPKAAPEGLVAALLTPSDPVALNRIELRIEALMLESKDKLTEIQERARQIMNIVLMEEVALKAEALALMGKDTAPLAMAVAAISQIRDRPEQSVVPEMRLIEGKANPPNPLTEAVNAFLVEHEMA